MHPRTLLDRMFAAAIEAAQPAHCIPPHLPPVPRGRLIVIGAGKASAEMARVVEQHWPGPLSGLVVTRSGYAVRGARSESVEAAHLAPQLHTVSEIDGDPDPLFPHLIQKHILQINGLGHFLLHLLQ